MKIFSRSHVRVFPIGLALLTVLIPLRCLSAQDSRPRVRTAFVLESPEFRDSYGEEISAQVEGSLAAELSRHMVRYYPFLQWEAAGSPGADTIATELRLTMVSRSGDFAPKIELLPTIRLDSQTLGDLDPPVMPLYGSFDPQPTDDSQQLLADIADTLTAFLRNDAFRAEVHEHLLAQIPLVNDLEVLESDRQIAIPLRLEEISAGTESIFRVTFVSSTPSTGPADGSMELKVQGRLRQQGAQAPAIRCMVIEFSFPDHVLPPGFWFAELPTILEHVEHGSLKVFMQIYRFDPHAGAEDGLVATLPEGE